jgi:xylulokinase
MVNVESEFTPNEKTRALYDEANKVYRGLYEAIANAGQYQALSDFSTRNF